MKINQYKMIKIFQIKLLRNFKTKQINYKMKIMSYMNKIINSKNK